MLWINYDIISSTNDYAQLLAVKLFEIFPYNAFTIRALTQTSGRGQWGRSWQSDPGNLFFTMAIRLQSDEALVGEKIKNLSLESSLLVAEVIKKNISHNSNIQFKQPNDILIEGRKVAGILVEIINDINNRPQYVIVGCGVNCVSHPYDGTISYDATNLSVHTKDLDVEHFYREMALSLSKNLSARF